MPKPPQSIVGQRERYLIVLAGVVVGYFAGLAVEGRYGMTDARIAGAMAGGLLAGILGRFALDRFREPPQSRRLR